jgi:hypothetical protein
MVHIIDGRSSKFGILTGGACPHRLYAVCISLTLNLRASQVSTGDPAKPPLPDLSFPVKLALVGQPFSGKTTLAQEVTQSQGLALIDPVALVTAAVAAADDFVPPVPTDAAADGAETSAFLSPTKPAAEATFQEGAGEYLLTQLTRLERSRSIRTQTPHKPDPPYPLPHPHVRTAAHRLWGGGIPGLTDCVSLNDAGEGEALPPPVEQEELPPRQIVLGRLAKAALQVRLPASHALSALHPLALFTHTMEDPGGSRLL